MLLAAFHSVCVGSVKPIPSKPCNSGNRESYSQDMDPVSQSVFWGARARGAGLTCIPNGTLFPIMQYLLPVPIGNMVPFGIHTWAGLTDWHKAEPSM